MFSFFKTSLKTKISPTFSNINFDNLKAKGLYNSSKAYFTKYRKPNTSWYKGPGFEHKRRFEGIWEAGLWMFTFGLCYSAIPFYSILCQHFGFDTDLKQKDYSDMQRNKDKKLDLHRKFRVKFQTDIDPDLKWTFEPVQDEVIVGAGETALVFFKVVNSDNKPVIGFSTYEINPPYATLFFSKIQCFCFHQQLLNPFEELHLPLYFYLEPEICEDEFMQTTNDELTIIYKFIRAKKQNLAKMAQEELRKVERNKQILKEMRKEKRLKEKGEIKMYDYEDDEDDDSTQFQDLSTPSPSAN